MAVCSEEAWRKVFHFLSFHEVARAGFAFLSNRTLKEHLEHTWNPQVLEFGSWPNGGFNDFLAAARATYISASVFSKLPRAEGNEETLGRFFAAPRSIMVPGKPSALSFNGRDEAREGLLAVAMGREIKLVGREDLSNCGTFGLALPKGSREVGTMALSCDSSILAVVPHVDFGSSTAEVQFYATEEKGKPMVTKLRDCLPLGVEFCQADACTPSASDHAISWFGAGFCKIAVATADVVASWRTEGSAELNGCRVLGAHTNVTFSGQKVSLWDLRTSGGPLHSVEVGEVVTTMDASKWCSSSVLFLGDEHGSLHCLDWRTTDAPCSQVLWKQPNILQKPLAARKLMVERGCACLLTDSSLTMLTMEPSLTQLGQADIQGRLHAVTCASGVWALAMSELSGRSNQFIVAIVDSSGQGSYLRKQKELLEVRVQKSEQQKKQKEKKKESQGKKPSSGKSAHGRNSGR